MEQLVTAYLISLMQSSPSKQIKSTNMTVSFQECFQKLFRLSRYIIDIAVNPVGAARKSGVKLLIGKMWSWNIQECKTI